MILRLFEIFFAFFEKKLKKTASFHSENLYLWYKVIFPKGCLKVTKKILYYENKFFKEAKK